MIGMVAAYAGVAVSIALFAVRLGVRQRMLERRVERLEAERSDGERPGRTREAA